MKKKKEKIKVAITDDHELLCSGIAGIINGEEDMKVTIIANNGKILLDKLAKGNIPDVLLLDIEMPIMDGYETIENLIVKHSNIKIIVLSMHCQYPIISSMLSQGVSGYLMKNTKRQFLLDAIRKVADDGVVYCDEAMKVSQMMNRDKEKIFVSKSDFSQREIDVIKLVCNEQSNKEISEKLNICKSTVEFHKRSIFKKMNVKSSAGCVNFALVNRIV